MATKTKRPAPARAKGSSKAGARGGRTGAGAKRTTSRTTSRAKSNVTAQQPKSRSDSPMRRVRRVAVEVAHQAQAAVSGGVEALKDLGETIAERVR